MIGCLDMIPKPRNLGSMASLRADKDITMPCLPRTISALPKI